MTIVGKPEATERFTEGQEGFDWTSHLTRTPTGPSTALCGKEILGIPANDHSLICKKCMCVYEERYGTLYPWMIR